jgi:hypothetical protein
MNTNPPCGFNATHTHPGAQWSWVYYAAQPDDDDGSSRKIKFRDPRSDLPNWRLLKAPAFSAKKTIRPMPGELILLDPAMFVGYIPMKQKERGLSLPLQSDLPQAPQNAKNRGVVPARYFQK